MKSPAELAQRLARQWEIPDLREMRLIGETDWPLRLFIGRPLAGVVEKDWISIVKHIHEWRMVKVGTVVWEAATYRATGEAVEIPVFWEIPNARQWVDAAASRTVTVEFSSLNQLLSVSDPLFHPLFIRQRSLWKDKPLPEIHKAAELAILLEPGCAHGSPLRSLSLAGIDSKFFERHRGLVTRLLDLRFDGEASKRGLETFLDAWQEFDHWLLVADLDGDLLPFSQQRVRSSELINANLAVRNLLVVENERCLHLLPRQLPRTIAVLGSGNNLLWLAAPWVQQANVAYWGDVDTWGLTLLASARTLVPGLAALLMTREIFERYTDKHGVKEPVIAGSHPPAALSDSEHELYRHLLTCENGRIEQEFISRENVDECLRNWLNN